jgi:hypothetical protein
VLDVALVEDLADVGAVGQLLDHGQDDVLANPPQQVGPGRGCGLPQVHAEEAAVGQQEHARSKRSEDLAGQGVLAGAQPADRGGELATDYPGLHHANYRPQ